MFNRFYFVHKRQREGVSDERDKKKSNTGSIIQGS